MKRIIKRALCAIVTVASIFSLAAPALAEDTAEKVTLIVQMENGSTVEQMNAAAQLSKADSKETERNVTNRILKEQKNLQRRIFLSVDSSINFGYNYTAAINGFSMDANPADISAIKKLDGVKNVYISRSHPLTDPVDRSGSVTPSEISGNTVNISALHEEGYTGEGMVIAIVDSEFDVNHEFLSCDVKNPKYTKESMAEAIANNELNAGASANRVWHSEKIPFAYNYTDKNSDTYTSDPQLIHGTHVAGIAAGKGGTMMDGTLFDGNAPEAQLLCMAVPSLEDDVNIAAIDDAIKLGADVLNASWGTDYLEAGLYDEIFSNAALAGMYICCSAGNSTMGYNEIPPAPEYYDYGSVGNPCDNDYVTTVASADNTKEWLDTLHIYVDGQEAAPVEEQNYGVPFENTVDSENGMEYVMCGSDYTGSQNMTGKIAVFDLKDEDSTAAIFAAARNGGASAVIVLVPEDLFNDWFYLDSEIVGDMPSVTVPDTQRQLFSNGQRITADKFKTLRLSKDYVGMSYYSSWGVFDTLNLDPNITAIGGNVYSSVPDNKYDVFSGTSMASPQLAGSVAVIKEYLLKNEASFSDLTPTERNIEIENRMMSTAKAMYARNDEGELLPCSPRHMGAGLLDAVAAVTTPVVLKGESGRTKIELRDKLTDDISFTFSANSLTDKAVTYDTVSMIAFTNETDMGQQVLPFSVELKTASLSIPQSVTVPAGGSADVNVSFSLDPQQVSGLEEVYINGFYVDGFVYLSDSTGEVPSLVIPFMGFHGDWNSGKVLDTYSFTDSYLNGIKLGSHDYDWHMMVPNVYGHLIDACRRIGRNDILTLHYWELEDTVDLEQVFDSERFAGISPNGDNSFDYLCISVIPLRNASSLVFGIKSSDGTVLLSYETQEDERINRFIGISHVFWLDELRSAGVDKEGEYTAFITAYRTPDSEPETVEMPFYVDNTAPEIEKFEIDGNTLKISAKDSRYLMGVELTDVKTGDWLTAIPVPGTGESDFTVDITEWADKDIKVSVMDYAKNKTVRYVGNILMGDTDGNGEIDNVDLVTLARYIVNLEEFDGGQIARSDLNSDGIADNTDLVELARYLVK